MSKIANEPTPAPPEVYVYERTFLRTVLRLYGVMGTPTNAQVTEAMNTLERFGLQHSKMRDRDLAIDDTWLKGRMPEHAAVEHAFMFVRFHSVLPPNAGQVKALNDWLAGGLLH